MAMWRWTYLALATLALALDRSHSGLRARPDGGQTYTVAFVPDGSGDPAIMGVVNTVEQYPDGASGMDAVAERFSAGLGGTRTDLPPPAVGEASRAFTTTRQMMVGAVTASTAFIVLRRGNVVASVAVAAMGNTPQTDVALRLAQDVD